MKNIIIALLVIILIGVGVYFFIQSSSRSTVDEKGSQPPSTDISQPVSSEQANATSTSVIGESVEKRDITAYHYGNGDVELLFVGGIHGGYSWNTVLVAYELMDYLEKNSNVIPDNVRVTVIPVMNPDGLNKVVGTVGRFTQADVPSSKDKTTVGRFNGNTVDLNRNFDCDWQSTGKWQNTTVKAGSAPFSEPESQAIKSYVEKNKPSAVVVWYSAAGGVFSSNCHSGILPDTVAITKVYADASGYPAYDEFDFYEITGDMVNWLAKKSIPAISVLLTTHDSAEWTKNRAGVEALLKHYAE